jgi:acetaldehyde dehydrogenase (acetylating)
MTQNRIKVVILGTGNIGTDLCARLLDDADFEVVAFVGRRADSPGLNSFEGKVNQLISNGVGGLIDSGVEFEGVFDATSAYDHRVHWDLMRERGKWMIDLTPSRIGTPFVPELLGKVSGMEMSEEFVANYSMVTCGGQSSAPLLYAMSQHASGITEVEVSSSIASLSAGPATRRNIDQYIQSTENLVSLITGCSAVKSILVLNPAEPPVMMRTTVHMKVTDIDLEATKAEAQRIVSRVKRYVPGYDIVVEPHTPNPGQISATAKVTGAGYVLPEYAGNLDIINAAAVETARQHSLIFRQKMEAHR